MLTFALFCWLGTIFAAALIARGKDAHGTILKGARLILAALAFCAIALAVSGGCGITPTPYEDVMCTAGTRLWRCTFTITRKSCGCKVSPNPPEEVSWPGCGIDAESAAINSRARLEQRLGSFGLLLDGVVYNTSNATVSLFPVCIDTEATACGAGKTIVCPYPPPHHRVRAPGSMPQTGPGGCATDPSDDPCISCAKTSCCSDYQACFGDPGCACWVGCEFAGNTDDVCAMPGNCGPLNAVSMSAIACLDAACPSQCPTMGSMGGDCSCGGTTSTSSGGASCTPGPTGSGEPCFSDGDCASCICSTQTMTCD